MPDETLDLPRAPTLLALAGLPGTGKSTLARERLARDAAAGAHPAANRDPELHARLAAQAEPLALPPGVLHVVVDSGSGTTPAHVAAVLTALRGGGSRQGAGGA